MTIAELKRMIENYPPNIRIFIPVGKSMIEADSLWRGIIPGSASEEYALLDNESLEQSPHDW